MGQTISAQRIKLCADQVCGPLQILFQNIIDTGILPAQWKEANVTSVHKKKDKQTVSNYRSISLLPLFAKTFEIDVCKNLYQFLKENGLITKNQPGSTPGHSGTDQLMSLVRGIHNAFDKNSCLDVRIISAAKLQHDLDIISEWANQWKMSFNPDPIKPAEEFLFL